MLLAHRSVVEVRNRQHPSMQGDTSVPLLPKQFGFFKCLEVKSSSSHSSSNSAGPQENKAADTRLCEMFYMKWQHFPRDHQIEWKDTNHRGLWDRGNTTASLAQASGEHCSDWRTRADSREGNKKVAISIISEFLLPDGMCWLLCSSSACQRVRNPQQSSCFL